MKLMKSLTTAATAVLLTASLSTASAGGYGFTNLSHAGKACPSGTVDYSIAPDGKTMTVLFDNYEVEVGGGQRNSKRKSCNLGISVHVPQGYAVGLIDVDYRGYVDLPKRSKAVLKREYFFSGQRGPRKSNSWKGAKDTDYFVRDSMATFSTTWSKCGRDVILRANTSMKVKTKGAEASAAVDSVDLNGRMIYNLRWKKCK